MQKLMIKAQDKAKEIRHLQDTVLPKLKQQLADTKGIFKGKERKAFMATYRKAEAVVAQYNRDLAAWERQVRGKRKPAAMVLPMRRHI